MDTEPFFRRERDHLMPTPACRGPWDPNSLHGRVLAGLAAFEIERLHGDPALQPARLTIDLYRLPDFSPITVHTIGTFSSAISSRLRAIASDWPRSSAPTPG